MANYAPKLPQDIANMALQEYPAAIPAKARYVSTPVASSVVTLTDNTTSLEIGAIGGGGIFHRWVPSTDTAASVTSSNFDHFTPAGTIRRFVVPIDTTDTPQPTSQVGVNVKLGLYSRVAWINATGTSSSVVGTEY